MLALGAALSWGLSDFLGGLKGRSVPVVLVLLISQATALGLLTVIVLVRGAGPPDTESLIWAVAAGLSEMVGIAALYRGLSTATMSIVVPAAATAPVVPLVVGLPAAQVPGPLQTAGVILAIIGIVVTARRPGTATATRVGPSIGYGLLAALGFGLFFTAMDTASHGDIGWALLAARLASVTVMATVALALRPRPAVHRTELPTIAAIGALIVAADSMYATASTLGLLGVVAVLGSLHTIVTIALARIFLKEHLHRLQRFGVAITLTAVVAISAG
ncbi:DMT family transporter [Actinomadura sp. HBU206391]|uniref:DMT family transporter n=1 Tax=Actinomadura sp. HBU206391 TaxID=2731692 RepID=UPI001650719D|nr:DMT family transporter [Actinomadura sp. HBU206391]